MPDDRQRLIVALVQKKVAEAVQDERFGASFQMGMLVSFESFFRTAKVKKDDDSNLDAAEQTDSELEKEGLDTPRPPSTSFRIPTGVSFGRLCPIPQRTSDLIVGFDVDDRVGGCALAGRGVHVFEGRDAARRTLPSLDANCELLQHYFRFGIGVVGATPFSRHMGGESFAGFAVF